MHFQRVSVLTLATLSKAPICNCPTCNGGRGISPQWNIAICCNTSLWRYFNDLDAPNINIFFTDIPDKCCTSLLSVHLNRVMTGINILVLVSWNVHGSAAVSLPACICTFLFLFLESAKKVTLHFLTHFTISTVSLFAGGNCFHFLKIVSSLNICLAPINEYCTPFGYFTVVCPRRLERQETWRLSL